jgi:gamma-glutamyl:cysteine ligase YbdK (ATP-grasp superfamily)
VRQMVRTGTLLDAGMVYFDARLSERYPTIEIRVADVCLQADDAVLIAALARALVETEARGWRQGTPVRQVRAELLRLAAWRASRSGWTTCSRRSDCLSDRGRPPRSPSPPSRHANPGLSSNFAGVTIECSMVGLLC